MRNAPDTEYKVHSLLLLFSRAFYVYPLLFRSLQYIYESLYRSYPSGCLCRIQRQPESYSLSCSDHANNLSLLIRFQHAIHVQAVQNCCARKQMDEKFKYFLFLSLSFLLRRQWRDSSHRKIIMGRSCDHARLTRGSRDVGVSATGKRCLYSAHDRLPGHRRFFAIPATSNVRTYRTLSREI